MFSRFALLRSQGARSRAALIALIVVLLAAVGAVSALTLTLTTSSGDWVDASAVGKAPNNDPDAGSIGPITCLGFTTSGGEPQVYWGQSGGGCGSGVSESSGFGIRGASGTTFTVGDHVPLGEFIHYNNPIIASFVLYTIDLDLTLNFSNPAGTVTTRVGVKLHETPNATRPCPYNTGDVACSDRVTLFPTVTRFTLGGLPYSVLDIGFIDKASSPTCVYNPALYSTVYISAESGTRIACIFGQIRFDGPQSTIALDITPPTQQVNSGSTAPLTFHVTNTSPQDPSPGVTFPAPVNTVSVTSPQCASAPVYQSGDTDGDNELDWDETWIFTCTTGPISSDTPVSGTATANDLNDEPVPDATDTAAITVVSTTTISGRVWVDTDADGVQDSGEPGYASGTTVELLNGGGTPVDSTTTNGSGNYTFSGVLPGTYSVRVNLPSGYTFSPQNQGGDTTDSDVSAGGVTASFAVAAATPVQNVDAGIYQSSTVSGRVWIDSDGDGVQDGGESGYPDGTTVELLSGGSPVASTTTDGGGNYSFLNVPPGTYTIRVTLPGGQAFTLPNVGDDTTDSDVNGSGVTGSFIVGGGTPIANIDAGMYIPTTISGRVWVDSDGDGVQDGGEAGYPDGTTVTLLSGGSPINSTTTAPDGTYSFTNVAPGTYTVQVTLPGGYSFTLPNVGGDTTDSDVNGSGVTGSMTVTSGTPIANVDAGVFQATTISGRVWIDSDGDGVQDGGESGYPDGTTIELLSGGSPISSTTTGSDGTYSFTNIPPGTYTIRVTLPGSYVFTPQDQGSDTADSDVNSSGITGNIVVTSGTPIANVDAGIYQSAGVSGRVWIDTDGDGVQDGGESGYPDGTTVELLSGGSPVNSTTTAPDGTYSFTGLTPAQYTVTVTLPSGYTFTLPNVGGDTTDSDVDASGVTGTLTLVSGTPISNVDAGIYQTTTVSGRVWIDTDGDGVQDGGETAYPDGTTVELLSGGSPVASTTTDSDGLYSFTSVAPGAYTVRVTLPGGYTFTLPNVGADTTDSDVDTSGVTGSFSVVSGTPVANVDAGVFILTTLSGRVWIDTDGDGVQDGGETGYPAGTTVELLSGGSPVASTTTDADGLYSFDDVAPAVYTVRVTLPNGYTFTLPNVGDDAADSDTDSSGQTGLITVLSGTPVSNVDAGIVILTSISGRVWIDSDGDGVQDDDEPGYPDGTTVTLRDSGGTPIMSVPTNSDGSYTFTGVPPATYSIALILPGGYTFTRQDQGNDTEDSDVNGSGVTGNIVVSSGIPVANVDAGLFILTTISGRVWVDIDADGVQDGGEPAYPDGTTVELLSGGSPIASTTTGSDGSYSFANVVPASYTIRVTLPGSYVFSPQDQGTDTTDSDVNTSGETAAITVLSDTPVTNVDAGIYQNASLSGMVWVDTDGDGVRDGGESAYPDGTTVTLLNSGGTSIATATTAADGTYSFTGLTPAPYTVVVTLPDGYTFTLPNVGDDTTDSDVDASGLTASMTVLSGTPISNVDAGVFILTSISGRVWIDTDGDGTQDDGEPAYPDGTTVTLLSGGSPVNSTTTGSDGSYTFTNVPPGSYMISVTLPGGYTFTLPNVGGDTTDSDVDASGQTATITVLSGIPVANVDAGVFILTTISGRVWIDTNGDGTQDNGETGYPDGTTVELLSGGASIASTTTDSDGLYSFSNVAPAQYTVRVTLPDSYSFTLPNVGDDTADSDTDSAGQTGPITLLSGIPVSHVDAGVVIPTSISGMVWIDLDADGARETGDNAYPDGAAVTLRDAQGDTVATTTTNSDGLYSFTNVVPAEYTIIVTLPADYVFTLQDIGGDTTDSDVDDNGATSTIVVFSNTPVSGIDAGIIEPVTISGVIWIDLDADGVWDGNELPYPDGTLVTLLDAEGNPVSTTTTNSDGTYIFTGIWPGTYTIVFTLPDGTLFSPDGQDSDPDPTNGQSPSFTVTSGHAPTPVNAGVFAPATIRGTVWVDMNADGRQTNGEPGYRPGTRVTLTNAATGLEVTRTTTNNDGDYRFTDLPPGNYRVSVGLPDGYRFSPTNEGSNDTIDSDVNVLGDTDVIVVAFAATVANVDAGLYEPATLSGSVWIDRNADGLQNNNESPYRDGTQVDLLDSDGDRIATTTTNGSGDYVFSNLTPGVYGIDVTLPGGYRFSPRDRGDDDSDDSDVNTVGLAEGMVLSSGEQSDNHDAGVYPLAIVRGRVWWDANRNGRQDSGEPDYPAGTQVQLRTNTGAVTRTATTNVNGRYEFRNITPGEYAVHVTLPSGWIFSPMNSGSDSSDSDINPATSQSQLTAVARGATVVLDSGIYQPSAPPPTPAPPSPPAPLPPATIPNCPSGCSDVILYYSDLIGTWEIMRLDEQDPSRSFSLTGFDAVNVSPSYSPDRQWIVFASNREDDNWELYIAPTNGDHSQIRRVTYNEFADDTNPDWGPDNYVVYQSSRMGNWELYLIDMQTGGEWQLTDNDSSDVNAKWSPDGRHIVYQSDRDGGWGLYEMDINTLEVRALTGGQDTDALYNHRGDQFLFRSERDGSSGIYIMNRETGAQKRISDPVGNAINASWSYDDTMIVYQADFDGDLDIYVYDVLTEQTRKLTDNDVADYAPVWRCNNDVLFTSDVDDDPEDDDDPPEIYQLPARPIDALPALVERDARQWTSTFDIASIYPVTTLNEVDVDLEGWLPQSRSTAAQTSFLNQSYAVSDHVDATSIGGGEPWQPVSVCYRQ